MRSRLIIGFAAALLLIPCVVRAQAGAAAGIGFESYRFSDADMIGIDGITLLTVPLAARAPLVRGLALELSSNYARGTVERADGSSATLEGLTDTQVGLSVEVVPQVVNVTAVALLPTGKQELTAEEAEVAGIVAADLLPFRISNWGSGGGGGGSMSIAHSFGQFGLGASASYLVARTYDLATPTALAYRPGNQLRARLALDAATGTTGKASLQLTYAHSSDDELGGANLFRAGDRFQAMGSYAFAAGAASSGIVYAGLLHRAEGTFIVTQPVDAPSQNLYLVGGGLRLPTGGAVVLPSVDVRILRRGDGLDQGTIGTAGATAELRPGAGRFVIVPGLRARIGSAEVSEGSSTGFTGFDLSLGLRFGGGQP